MRQLLRWELKKIWYQRWTWVILVPVFILLFWLITMNWDPIRIHFDGRYRWMTEEFQTYWGVAITDEFRDYVRKRAEPYGITDDEFCAALTALCFSADPVGISLQGKTAIRTGECKFHHDFLTSRQNFQIILNFTPFIRLTQPYCNFLRKKAILFFSLTVCVQNPAALPF